MTSRERMLQACNHEATDRVPIDFDGFLASINASTYDDLLKETGIEDDGKDSVVSREWSTVPKPSEELLEEWGIDFRGVWLRAPDHCKPIIDEKEKTMIDEWGLTWKRFGRYYEFVNPPMEGATVRDVLAYKFPDPEDPGRYRGLKEWAETLYDKTEYAVVAGHSMFGVFELGCRLCSFNDFLLRIATGKQFVHVLFCRVLEIQKAIMGRYLDLVGPYVQMIETADDLGQKYNSMMSVETYRKLIKPYHKEYLSFIKGKESHARIFMHSYGSVHNLIPDLVDAGVEVLNPIQPTAGNMGAWRLKKDFGSRLCFHSGIDVVELLPKASANEVHESVRNTIRILGEGDGYILATSHNIQHDTPPANVVALYEAGVSFCRNGETIQ